MVNRIDIRVIIGFICVVATTYWLLLPRPTPNSSISSNKIPGKTQKDETAQKIKEENQGLGLSTEKMNALEENLGASLVRIKELEHSLAEKDAEVDRIKTELEEKSKKDRILVNKEETKNSKIEFRGHRLVHLDLKGAPPKEDYLRELLPFIKGHGATGLLVEYEDTYPYSGELSLLKAPDAYTEEQIKKFLDMAKELDLIIIPLIQTFGHLEFVLKHEKFAHLRETKEVTNSLCPLNKGSLELAKSLVKDILRLHPDSAWIHLGGDEVWNLKTCESCKSSSKTSAELYLHHMKPLFEFINSETNGKVTPIIWDDMLRSWNVNDLKAIAKLVQPMVWAYVPNLENYYKFPQGMWDRFHQAFSKIWIASSFKGAAKPTTNYVPLQQHINNHLSWLEIISKFPETTKVLGMALTGWSRFDHYGPLCELLPAGVPSLVFCLSVLHAGNFDNKIHETVSKALGFKKALPLDIQNFKSYVVLDGTFPGHEIFRVVSDFEKARGWFMSGKVREEGWARAYQAKTNNLGFYQLNVTLNSADICIDMLEKLQAVASKTLSSSFNKRTVTEWVDDKIKATVEEAKKMKENIKNIIKNAKL